MFFRTEGCEVTTPEEPFWDPIPMTDDHDQTNSPPPEFDYSAYPGNTLFHDRRHGCERRGPANSRHDEPRVVPERPSERRQKTERRRRIDPTTFEKQYTEDEMEFMTAIQRFKELTGKTFPTHGEVLRVAVALGYRRAVFDLDALPDEDDGEEPSLIIASTRDN
jgi:hypothetical protein